MNKVTHTSSKRRFARKSDFPLGHIHMAIRKAWADFELGDATWEILERKLLPQKISPKSLSTRLKWHHYISCSCIQFLSYKCKYSWGRPHLISSLLGLNVISIHLRGGEKGIERDGEWVPARNSGGQNNWSDLKGKASCPETAERGPIPPLLRAPAVSGKGSAVEPAGAQPSDMRSCRPRPCPGGRARGRAADPPHPRWQGMHFCQVLGNARGRPWRCSLAAKGLISTQDIAQGTAPHWAHKACSWGVSSSARLEGFEWMTCFIRSRSSWVLFLYLTPFLSSIPNFLSQGLNSPERPHQTAIGARAATFRWKEKLSAL